MYAECFTGKPPPQKNSTIEDPTEVDQKVGLSRNRLGSLTDKRTLPVAQAHELQIPNEKRPRKAEPSSPFGAGNEIRTHDFNLGNIRLAHDTIREIQQHQRHSVPWRCVPSRGVPWKVEG
jgi:hypothetical protein